MPNSHFIDTFRTQLINDNVFIIDSVSQMVAFFHEEVATNKIPLSSLLILGGGSNLLFVEPFDGVILLNQIKGIIKEETEEEYFLHVGAGESWHEFVAYTIEENIDGLENLALIPGTVGAAPIQNIGAYGAEFKMFCQYVDILDIETLSIERLFAETCQFGYRDSIFKRSYKNKAVILAVGFAIPKKWQPILTYGELKAFNSEEVTAKIIFNKICEVRAAKLPDPNVIGNAGSFFKNPIVDKSLFDSLLFSYPELPFYPLEDSKERVKLAAGWLIDKAGLKGHAINDAKVHINQALVLTNQGNATGNDIALLAKFVQEAVYEKFQVMLEPEVRFIGKNGEVDPLEYLSKLIF
ncbi:UDP-N-acetylmuramate dehydrogenase [Thorsellia kenyensis]|uniref:UDP-N-acetylenolpyruvoylglucosamine reductase n=1 Tax=Thorsellia kenyensis TaxID=1549888 RepID=A0ABV6C8S1_9GAMM